jgi:pimeloyl-ACP methyl ester carboxylesterase
VPSYIWDSTVTALTGAGFRVARYDLFGRGYSDRPDVRYTADLYDRQLLQLLDSLGWRDPIDLVGLSMGGPVTAEFTARHPERVRSLTLVDPAAGERSAPPFVFRLPLVGPVLWQTIAVPTMDDGQLTDFVEPAKWPDWTTRYREQMQYRGFGRALLSTLRESGGTVLDSVYARVGASGKPTLLLWGKEDSTVAITHADGVRKAIPQAQYHPIDRAGHLPHMERTDVVNPLLITFLRSNTIGRRETGNGKRVAGDGGRHSERRRAAPEARNPWRPVRGTGLSTMRARIPRSARNANELATCYPSPISRLPSTCSTAARYRSCARMR